MCTRSPAACGCVGSGFTVSGAVWIPSIRVALGPRTRSRKLDRQPPDKVKGCAASFAPITLPKGQPGLASPANLQHRCKAPANHCCQATSAASIALACFIFSPVSRVPCYILYVCTYVYICKYLHVSKFMYLRNTYIYVYIRAIRTSKDIH